MIIHEVAQGGEAWRRVRAGIPTASCFDKIMTPGAKGWAGETKGKPGKSESATKYMNHLLAERALGMPIEGFKSSEMEAGNQNEDRAIAAYEIDEDCETERIGFVTTDDGRIGCSPDRIRVGTRIGVEAKSPSAAVHISYQLCQVGASHEYKVQLQGQILVCELEAVDIVSEFEGLPTCRFRVNRDDLYIKELEAHVRAFSCQLEEKVELFRERGWIKAAPVPEAVDGIPGLGISDEDIEIVKRSYGWS